MYMCVRESERERERESEQNAEIERKRHSSSSGDSSSCNSSSDDDSGGGGGGSDSLARALIYRCGGEFFENSCIHKMNFQVLEGKSQHTTMANR